MLFVPHEYQTRCIRRILKDESAGLFLDMGLGKTVITLTALSEMRLNRLEIGKTLVIAPKKVAQTVWPLEAEKWEHLQALQVVPVLGTISQRQKALESPGDVYVINRENVQWLVDYLGACWPFDCLVIDELSSFKNPSAKRFRALKKVIDKFSRVYGLTGTPAPNGYMDLWPQIYLLDGGERLEKTITGFRTRYANYNPYTREYKLKKGAEEVIKKKISDLCVSMSAEDYLELPEKIINDVPVVLEGKALKSYNEMERDAFLEFEGEEYVAAINAAALSNKLLQMAGGACYLQENSKEFKTIHGAKIDMLIELIEGLQEENALIFYNFKHEALRILEALQKHFKGEKIKELDGARTVNAWNEGRIKALIAHPASSGHGLNLQAGGRHVVWFSLPWSLELYEQANARLYRQGQLKPVMIHRLITKGTRDEDVKSALEAKRLTQAELLESLKARGAKWTNSTN